MATAFKMPKFGMTMEEGTITRWIKNEGDPVRKGEALLEIETDKALMDVEAEQDGYLIKIVARETQTLPCGETIAWIGAQGEAAPV